MKQAILITIAVLIFAILVALGAPRLYGQDDVPLTVETKTDDYVIVDPALYELLAQQDAKLNLALDEIAEIKAMLQGGYEPTTEPESPQIHQVNINALPKDKLAVLLDRLDVYQPGRRAELIWTWIHEGGGALGSIEDLKAIPGIGEKTWKPLEPHIKYTDDEGATIE